MAVPLPSYSELIALLKKGVTIEAQEQIMNLREAVTALQEENLSLKQEIIKVKEELEIKSKLVWDGHVYWIGTGNKDGPYCHNCYDTKRILVHLRPDELNGSSMWFCSSCKTYFKRK